MQSQISEISSVLVEVTVQVPWADVEKAMEGSYAQLSKTAQVKGFRPGKVPRPVLKQVFGARVKQEVVSNLVEAGLGKAVEQHSLAVVHVPPLDKLPELKTGEGLSFTAKVEVQPKIEKLNLEGLALTRDAVQVTDAQIDEAVERLRQSNAELAAPEPMRGAQEGDVLTCDYTVSIDGKLHSDLGATGRAVELSGQLLPELKAALLGKQPGDQVETDVQFPADAGGDLAGKFGHFALDLKELKHKVLPELDDEFAKDLEYASLAELRQKTRERLETAAKQSAEEKLREQAIEQLVEKNPIEPPPSMVAQQQNQIFEEYLRILRMTGQKPALDPSFFEGARADAEKRVRAGLLLGALARTASITVQVQDLDKKLEEMATRTGKHIAKIRAEINQEQRQRLESHILEEKLLEYLLAQATITEAAT